VPQLYRLNLSEKELMTVSTVIDYLRDQDNYEDATFLEMKLSKEGYLD